MPIKTRYIERQSLEEFLEKYNLTLTIEELKFDDGLTYMADIEPYMKDEGLQMCLSGFAGYGKTPNAAVKQMIADISGETIIEDTCDKEERKIIKVPILYVSKDYNIKADN